MLEADVTSYDAAIIACGVDPRLWASGRKCAAVPLPSVTHTLDHAVQQRVQCDAPLSLFNDDCPFISETVDEHRQICGQTFKTAN